MPTQLDRPPIHPFVPSPTGERVTTPGKLGTPASWPACAVCGQPARSGHKRASPTTSRARDSVPASTIPPVGAGISRPTPERAAERAAVVERYRERVAVGPAPVEPNVEHAPPWQLKALELHVAEALRVDVSYALRILLLDTQRAIRSELAPTTVRRAPAVEPPKPPPVEHRPVEPPRADAPLSAGLSVVARGIRNDKMRDLFRRAIGAGWSPKVLGNGHLRLTGPTGSSFTLSMTSDCGARAYKNDRAQAKRAGLDVTGL
jgi:hypothetical protein